MNKSNAAFFIDFIVAAVSLVVPPFNVAIFSMRIFPKLPFISLTALYLFGIIGEKTGGITDGRTGCGKDITGNGRAGNKGLEKCPVLCACRV